MKKLILLIAILSACSVKKNTAKMDKTGNINSKQKIIIYTYTNMDFKGMGIDTSKYHNR